MTAAHSFGSVATCFLPTTSEGLLRKVKTSTPCSAWNILEPQPTLLSSVHEFTLTASVCGLDLLKLWWPWDLQHCTGESWYW